MQSILNNPYRVIGVLAGSKSKDIDRQVRRLKAFLDAGQASEDDSSFPILGHFSRNIADIEAAVGKINLDKDKVLHSVLWFCNGNEITDEPALEALAIGDLDSATRIWAKHVSTGVVNKRTVSAFNNLSSLQLVQAFGEDDEELFRSGLESKLELIESEVFPDFVKSISHETFSIDSKSLQINLLSIVKNELEVSGLFIIDNDAFINVLSDIEFTAKSEFFSSMIDEPSSYILSQIESIKKKRKSTPKNANSHALNLIELTKEKIVLLDKLDNGSNYRIDSIKDKLAEEILQCAIDYYNVLRDTDIDPGLASIKLVEFAGELAQGQVLLERIIETQDTIQEWVDEAGIRNKFKPIQVNFNFVHKKLEDFQSLRDTPSSALDLVISSKPHLVAIASHLGKNDDLYVKLSSAVAGNALGMLITAVNTAQENVSAFNIDNVKGTIGDACSVMQAISELRMDEKLRIRFNENERVITSLKNDLNSASQKRNNSSANDNSGCLWLFGIAVVIWIIASL